MTSEKPRRMRCAIYTRKSTEEGLEQEFNSLDAQREACEAYIASQRSEGWVMLREHYDDGGISGGTLARPALQRLLADVEDGLVDVIVVYKIDRLSRSLADFAKMVDIFDRNNVTFVSVTQSFNTTNSMGRLTLNILLSFAQFEREVTAERIRDKFAASRKRGLWMGGNIPYGYDLVARKLVVNPHEAEILRWIFKRFVSIGSVTKLVKDLHNQGITNKAGRPFDKGAVNRILKNRLYLGEAVHKGTSYPGEHDALITPELWGKVDAIRQTNPRKRANNTRAKVPALLKGLLFSATGAAMTPTSTKKGNKLYRYYVSLDELKGRQFEGIEDLPKRLPADTVENAVVGEIRRSLQTPEVTAKVLACLEQSRAHIPQDIVVNALQEFNALWAKLFPGEQARIIQLLVRKVTVTAQGLVIDLRTEAIASVMQDLIPPSNVEAAE